MYSVIHYVSVARPDNFILGFKLCPFFFPQDSLKLYISLIFTYKSFCVLPLPPPAIWASEWC